jgi:hypothetical protein
LSAQTYRYAVRLLLFQEQSGSRTESDQASTFRNSALARIMSRGDRPARPRVDRDTSQPRSSASKASPSTHHIEETAASSAVPLQQEDGKSKGDRLVEKLLRSTLTSSENRMERTDEPESMTATHSEKTASIASTAPTASQPMRTPPTTVLERIDEQTQEGQESLSFVSPSMTTGKAEVRVEAEEGGENTSINTSSSAVSAVQEDRLPQTPPRHSEPQAISTPSVSVQLASITASSLRSSPEKNLQIDKQEGRLHDLSSAVIGREEATAEAIDGLTPTAAPKVVAEEQQWEDVETVQVATHGNVTRTAPVMRKESVQSTRSVQEQRS